MSSDKHCPQCGHKGAALMVSNATSAAAKGAAAGGLLGTAIPVIGTTVGAAIGGVLGFLDGTAHYKCKKCKHEWDD